MSAWAPFPWVRGRSCPPTALDGLDEVLGIAGTLGTVCTPGNLIPAHCRGSLLTIIGTHLNSVYRAKIRFEAGGVLTQAIVSTGVWGHRPSALPPHPKPLGTLRAGAQHLPAHRNVRARWDRSGCCAAVQPSPSRARWRWCWGT